MYRQGDILLVPTSRKDGAPVPREDGRIVLAHGEVTGHAHTIADEGCELVETLDERFLRVLAEGGVTLTHQEHAAILLPPGDYQVIRQREYTPEAVRQVAD